MDGVSSISKASAFEGLDRITVRTPSNANTDIFESFQAIITCCILRRLSSESNQVMGQSILVPADGDGTVEVLLVKLATAIFCTLLDSALSERCIATSLVNSKHLDRNALTKTAMVRFVHSSRWAIDHDDIGFL